MGTLFDIVAIASTIGVLVLIWWMFRAILELRDEVEELRGKLAEASKKGIRRDL